MKISVYNAKGGVGKTPIATNIVLDRDYAIATNERRHLFHDFECIPDTHVLAVDLTRPFPTLPADKDVVFDLAGAISEDAESITTAIEQSDVIIVPMNDEVKSLSHGIWTLEEVEAIKRTDAVILVVATKLDRAAKERGHDWLKSRAFLNIEGKVNGAGFDVPVLPLRFSKIFDHIFEQEKSISHICDATALGRYTYRDIKEQFHEIYCCIDEVAHAK